MKNHDKMDDEKLLRLAAMSIHENAVAEYEALEDDPTLATEQEIQKQWNAVMKNYRKRKYHGLLSSFRGELLKKIAAVIAALSVLGGSVTATVVAVNPKIRDVFDTDFEDHSILNIVFSDKQPEIPEEWDERYYPTYIPDGFEYLKIDKQAFKNEITYQRDGTFLRFAVFSMEVNNGSNTEEMLSMPIEINGVPSILYTNEQDKKTVLIIPFEDCVIRIGGSVQSSEVILIGESIEIKD